MSLMLKPFRDAQPAGSSVTCAQTDRQTDRSLVAVGAQALESGSWGRGSRDEKLGSVVGSDEFEGSEGTQRMVNIQDKKECGRELEMT